MPAPGRTAAPAPPIRFGIHGSPGLAIGILRDAGRDENQVRWCGYDVADPFRGLRAGETDVMIVKYAVHEGDLAVSRPVAHDPRAVLLSVHHPLAGRSSVSLDDLADYDAFECPGDFPADVWDQIVPPYTGAGRPIRRRHQMTTLARMVELLTETHAIHISFASLHATLPSSIAIVPIRDLPPAPVALCWLRDAELPAHVARFIADAEAGHRA